MIVHTYTAGDYRADVMGDATVNVYHLDELIDWPGPWADADGAHQWAQAIVEKYAAEGHPE